MADSEQLLQPFAGADPCGVDLEYDNRFAAIRDLVSAGRPEAPVEWKKIRKQCIELLNDGRSVELLIFLTSALVATEGYSGLRDGLHILAKSLEEFWESIYPKLDESEPEEERYAIRLNLLAQLGEPVRKMGDPLGFLEKVLRAPLTPSESKASPGYWSVWERDAGGGASDPGEAAVVVDHLSRMGRADIEALSQLLQESIASLQGLGSFLLEKTQSAYNAPFDEYLLPALKKIHADVEAAAGTVTAPIDEPGPAAESGTAPAASASAPAAARNLSGEVQSTADVRKALSAIMAYYRKAEPSSPVPYLLKRAERLIDAEFIDIVKNLNADAEHQFRTTLDITET